MTPNKQLKDCSETELLKAVLDVLIRHTDLNLGEIKLLEAINDEFKRRELNDGKRVSEAHSSGTR